MDLPMKVGCVWSNSQRLELLAALSCGVSHNTCLHLVVLSAANLFVGCAPSFFHLLSPHTQVGLRLPAPILIKSTAPFARNLLSPTPLKHSNILQPGLTYDSTTRKAAKMSWSPGCADTPQSDDGFDVPFFSSGSMPSSSTGLPHSMFTLNSSVCRD